MIRDGCPDLVVEFGLERRWQVDAPEMAVLVPLECFEDEPSCDSAGDPCLDNLERLDVMDQTPDRPREARLAVAPTCEGPSSQPQPVGLEGTDHPRPEPPELGDMRTRPGRPNKSMELAFPVFVYLVWAWRPRHERARADPPAFTSFDSFREPFPDLDGQLRRVTDERVSEPEREVEAELASAAAHPDQSARRPAGSK